MNSAEQQARERALLEQKFADSLGAELHALLDDPRVCDVMINPDGCVFVEREGEQVEGTGICLRASRRAALVKTAMAMSRQRDQPGAAILETWLPDRGWRLEGVLPPVVESPALSIRKPARKVYSLQSYVESGRMTLTAYEVLREAVRSRRNVLVVGGTGSGKTTLVNALLREVAEACPEQRVLVLEDTVELRCTSPNSVAMLASKSGETMVDLVRASKRMRPDRIVVGEIRGPEVLAMLSAWNTGHPGGLCTVHADSARSGLLSLEQLCALGGGRESARLEISHAVQVVVAIGRSSDGHRCVREVVSVEGLDAQGDYVCKQVA